MAFLTNFGKETEVHCGITLPSRLFLDKSVERFTSSVHTIAGLCSNDFLIWMDVGLHLLHLPISCCLFWF